MEFALPQDLQMSLQDATQPSFNIQDHSPYIYIVASSFAGHAKKNNEAETGTAAFLARRGARQRSKFESVRK